MKTTLIIIAVAIALVCMIASVFEKPEQDKLVNSVQSDSSYVIETWETPSGYTYELIKTTNK